MWHGLSHSSFCRLKAVRDAEEEGSSGDEDDPGLENVETYHRATRPPVDDELASAGLGLGPGQEDLSVAGLCEFGSRDDCEVVDEEVQEPQTTKRALVAKTVQSILLDAASQCGESRVGDMYLMYLNQ
jgi:hypothetical protein